MRNKAKVLIVEDEPLIMMMTVDVVEDGGFEALEASNADDAILLLETTDDIVIVLTDIDMPGSMDGLVFAAAVRDRWPPIKIVIVSGKRQPSADQIPAGGVFIAKPYDARTMTEALTRMVA